jgi:hypothetical protein
MTWDINLVDRWGKDVSLSTNNGFQSRVLNASPTWAKLWDDNGIKGNDGDPIYLTDILDVQGDLLKDALDAQDRGDKDVAAYLRKIVMVARKNYKDGRSMALAFN